ncbi:MAG: CDP-diacylglycerol--serine O-phosphatidyltransferase [Candidatus Neomarinimicrobiota bacterium]
MKFSKRISKHHIPSLFTLVNLFLGFLAVISVAEGYAIRAAYLIVAAGIFDTLDGKLARWVQGPSRFGMELDSLADLVSFCLAPALLIWSLYAHDLHPVLGALIAGAPLYFGALRLARYNIAESSKPRPYFEGLPVPMNAMTVVALVLYYSDQSYGGAAKVVLPVIMATSVLMISSIRYAKSPKFTFHAGIGNTLYLIGTLGVLALLPIFGGLIALPAVVIYLLSGLIRWLTKAGAPVDLQSMEKKV